MKATDRQKVDGISLKHPVPLDEYKRARVNIIIGLNKLFFRLIIGVLEIFHIPKQKLQSLFIKANNKLVRRHQVRVFPEKLLLLLPHCLQCKDCQQRISDDLDHCEGCGRCDICQLAQIKKKYQIPAFVVDGGQLALAVANRGDYKAIVAVACEKELEEGILESALPVLGIVNHRPEGPCRNTKVEVELVESAINLFLKDNQPSRESIEVISPRNNNNSRLT